MKLEDYPKHNQDDVDTINIIQSELRKLKNKLKKEDFLLSYNYKEALKKMLELIYYGA